MVNVVCDCHVAKERVARNLQNPTTAIRAANVTAHIVETPVGTGERVGTIQAFHKNPVRSIGNRIVYLKRCHV